MQGVRTNARSLDFTQCPTEVRKGCPVGERHGLAEIFHWPLAALWEWGVAGVGAVGQGGEGLPQTSTPMGAGDADLNGSRYKEDGHYPGDKPSEI